MSWTAKDRIWRAIVIGAILMFLLLSIPRTGIYDEVLRQHHHRAVGALLVVALISWRAGMGPLIAGAVGGALVGILLGPAPYPIVYSALLFSMIGLTVAVLLERKSSS